MQSQEEIKAYSQQKFEKLLPWFEAVNLNLLKAPIAIILLVTDKCGCRCHMCTHWQMKEKRTLDYDTFASVMVECERNGTQSAFLSGGDVFFWEHWERFLKDQSIRMDIQITTPLVLPPTFRDLNLLKRIKWMRVSFDAVREETFLKIRGVSGLDGIKADLKYIMDNKIIEDVGIATCLQKDNVDELEEMGIFIESLGIKRWIVQPVFYYEEKLGAPNHFEIGKKLKERFGKTIPINNFDVLIENYHTWHQAKNIPCVIPRMHAFIDTSLRVWPCCNIAQDAKGDEQRSQSMCMGKIQHGGLRAGKSFLNIWNNTKNYLQGYKDFKDIHKLCEYTCKFKYFYYNLGFEYCRRDREVIYV